MVKYSALIVDLKNSRDYNQVDRIEIQKFIKLTINSLNKLFINSLKFHVIFSAGDEVQGLFYSPEAAYLYFRLFSILISPVEVRAGIGVGEWSIKIDSTNSAEQDGPAYHNARYALSNIEDSLGYSVLLYSNNENDLYINSAINTATILENNQSQHQKELFLLIELMFPINIYDTIRNENMRKIKELVLHKNQIEYYANRKISKNSKRYLFISHSSIDFESTPTDALSDEISIYISSGKIKGLSNKLSKRLGTTRQNMDKLVKSGNIFQARNATIVALKLMNKYIKEES